MIFPAVSGALARFFGQWTADVLPGAGQPLLDDAELRELAARTQSLPWFFLDFQQDACHPLIGETLSVYRGRGLEFEDNRAYQPGDEPRLLNWRLYARSGELYTKVFTEERRPQVVVLADRRAAMRFGTRRQLKATLVARIGACYAYQARQQALAVGGLILNQAAEWLAPASGDASLDALVRTLAAPCPPLGFDQDQPQLEQGLRLVMHRLPAGCLVVLISDFADLDPQTARPILRHLSESNTVQAIQVLDPVERQLPAGGDFLIEDPASERPLRMDGRDAAQQARYAENFRSRQADLDACFRACGIPFRTCLTTDDLEACLGQPDGLTTGD
ncbi:MAG: DUF58 domain-containing protein [Gammaproteobacteria bacterium]|nr:DUF58 domain-containing protein [Gammaproteobacteria bacterium]